MYQVRSYRAFFTFEKSKGQQMISNTAINRNTDMIELARKIPGVDYINVVEVARELENYIYKYNGVTSTSSVNNKFIDAILNKDTNSVYRDINYFASTLKIKSEKYGLMNFVPSEDQNRILTMRFLNTRKRSKLYCETGTGITTALLFKALYDISTVDDYIVAFFIEQNKIDDVINHLDNINLFKENGFVSYITSKPIRWLDDNSSDKPIGYQLKCPITNSILNIISADASDLINFDNTNSILIDNADNISYKFLNKISEYSNEKRVDGTYKHELIISLDKDNHASSNLSIDRFEGCMNFALYDTNKGF